jgi:hypothetical protein
LLLLLVRQQLGQIAAAGHTAGQSRHSRRHEMQLPVARADCRHRRRQHLLLVCLLLQGLLLSLLSSQHPLPYSLPQRLLLPLLLLLLLLLLSVHCLHGLMLNSLLILLQRQYTRGGRQLPRDSLYYRRCRCRGRLSLAGLLAARGGTLPPPSSGGRLAGYCARKKIEAAVAAAGVS